MKKLQVTIWNEYRHERAEEACRAIYPNGIHGCIKEFLDKQPDLEVRLAALDDPQQGLPDEVLNNTDVLMWWGHVAHHEVDDALVEKIRQRVYTGKMGLIVMHSGHHSKDVIRKRSSGICCPLTPLRRESRIISHFLKNCMRNRFIFRSRMPQRSDPGMRTVIFSDPASAICAARAECSISSLVMNTAAPTITPMYSAF